MTISICNFNILNIIIFFCPGDQDFGLQGSYTSDGFRPHRENGTQLQVFLFAPYYREVNVRL